MTSVRKTTISGLLLSGNTILLKLSGMLTTMVLARFLSPEDFGIVAIANTVMLFSFVFTANGSSEYLLKESNIDNEKINTAWTINFLLKNIAYAALAIASVPIADFYDDPRLVPVLLILCFAGSLHSIKNPNTILLQRGQNYLPIVTVSIIGKLLSIVCSVFIAFKYQSYYALLASVLIMNISDVIGSYVIIKRLPKITLIRFKEQFSFSFWLWLTGIFEYLRNQLDLLIISFEQSVDVVGGVFIAKYLASLPSSVIISPLAAPLLAKLAETRSNCEYYRSQNLVVFYLFVGLGALCSYGIAVNARTIMNVIYGEQWIQYHGMLMYFAVLILCSAISNHMYRNITINGHTNLIFIINLATATVFITGITFVDTANIIAVLFIRVSTEVLCTITFFVLFEGKRFGRKYTLRCFFITTIFVLLCLVHYLLYLLTIKFVIPQENTALWELLNILVFTILVPIVLAIFHFIILRRMDEHKYIVNLLRSTIKMEQK